MPSEVLIPLGPLNVNLTNLQVVGAGPSPVTIIKSNEDFKLSLQVEFTPSPAPFTDFLMGVGLSVEASFEIEGFGPLPEIAVDATPVKTTVGTYVYTPTFKGAQGPAASGLTPGAYEAAAVMTIKGGGIPLAIGYIGEIMFQVY